MDYVSGPLKMLLFGVAFIWKVIVEWFANFDVNSDILGVNVMTSDPLVGWLGFYFTSIKTGTKVYKFASSKSISSANSVQTSSADLHLLPIYIYFKI